MKTGRVPKLAPVLCGWEFGIIILTDNFSEEYKKKMNPPVWSTVF
jgi:hypothetical protein